MHRDQRSARYRIQRRLGQGGMAEVFEAELSGDLGFVRKVAIKRMLESAAADAVAARRFLDEAVIASRLHHANVISVVDLGLLDDRPFQVLEYVDGIDAHRLLQRAGGTLPLEVALAIAIAVAHALDHAHTAVDAAGLPLGIVHRDVKPSNVLVSWSGDVKLGDFGIAVARDREATTEAGIVAGTQGFIAPEQRARGELDGRTDVFALGLTLHALVTGTSPFANIENEMRALAGEPVPIDPGIADEVRAILEGALALARTARPTAAQLAAQLGSALAPRLTGDPRSLLRDFLASYAPKPAPVRGALDGLLGIEVVMTGSSGDEVQRYETRAAASEILTTPEGARRSPIIVRSEAPVVARDAETQPTLPVERVSGAPTPRRRAAPIAVALIGAAGLGGLAIQQLGGSDREPVHGATSSHDARALEADVRSMVEDGALEPDALAADARIATPSPVRDAAVIVARRDAATRDATAVTPPVTRDAAPPEIGYLLVLGTIAGEDVIGARVIVDGKPLGSVPNTYPLPVGRHVVEIERRDGTRLPSRTIEIKAIHSRGNPLKPAW